MLFPDYRDAKITIKNFASCPVKVMSPCKGRDNFPIFKKQK